MAYLTEEYFRNIAGRMTLNEQRVFTDTRRATDPIDRYYDVFLSYNIQDKTVIMGLYYQLTHYFGLTVYLDYISDPDLVRSATDKKAADRIHNRLIHSKSLIYAQSSGAATSNWMPWELGVVDGNTNGKCMIMPVTSNACPASPKREYLLLYPFIKLNESYNFRVYTDQNPIMGQRLTEFILG